MFAAALAIVGGVRAGVREPVKTDAGLPEEGAIDGRSRSAGRRSRASAGEYVGEDGKRQHGTFCVI